MKTKYVVVQEEYTRIYWYSDRCDMDMRGAYWSDIQLNIRGLFLYVHCSVWNDATCLSRIKWHTSPRCVNKHAITRPHGSSNDVFYFQLARCQKKGKIEQWQWRRPKTFALTFFFVFEFLFETCHSQPDVASELFLPGIWFIVSMRNNKIDLIFHFETPILSFWFGWFRFPYRSILSDAFQPPLSQSHTLTSHNNIAVSLVSMHSV